MKKCFKILFSKYDILAYKLKNNFRKRNAMSEFYALVDRESSNKGSLCSSCVSFLLCKIENFVEKNKIYEVTKFKCI